MKQTMSYNADCFDYCDYIDTQFSGPWQNDILFLKEKHLKNVEMWKLFVSQFREKLDTPTNEKNGNGKWFGGWRGEYWGKSMRGAVSIYRVTKDETLYKTMSDTVEDLLSTADANGVISTYYSNEEFGLWDLWCRKYVLLGLEYFYSVCKSDTLKKQILKALCCNVDYITDKIGEGKRSITDSGHPVLGGLNASSILEPIVRLFSITENKQYLDFAEYIVSTGFSSLENIYSCCLNLTKKPYQFAVRKAYEMMSCMEGLLELYRVTSNNDYLKAVENFAEQIAKTDVTVIGGCGCDHERLDNSAVSQTNHDITTLKNETCVTVTWIKLCINLLKLTGKEQYANLAEKSAWNALRGAVNTKQVLFDFDSVEKYRGRFQNEINGINERGLPFDSYSPLLPGFRGKGVGGLKQMKNHAYYGCCACIGCAGVGLFSDASVLATQNGFVFNFYLSGKIKVKNSLGETLTALISSNYPYSNSVNIKILDCSKSVDALYFRIPAFCRKTEISYNGLEQTVNTSGSYFKLECSPKCDDEFIISFDINSCAIVQNGFASFSYGNLVMGFDERFGYNLDDNFDFIIGDNGNVNLGLISIDNSQALFKIPLKSGKDLTVCDYGSAGKDWHNNCKIAAWVSIDNTSKQISSECKIADDLI